jgi:2',3'-cyclic-nucleotide 2'-phosphodiesterase
MDNKCGVLMLGDVVGEAGLRALQRGIPQLVQQYKPDIVVANGENVSEGFGISQNDASRMFSAGISVVTTGNHVWQKREIFAFAHNGTILRPANYPGDAPGIGWTVVRTNKGDVGVLNIQGRVRLSNIDCPFRSAMAVVESFESDVRVILVDFHAEDAEEKEAMGHYLAGKVSVVSCSHTHIQSADERIIDDATAYISDLGMTGPVDSVIGFNPEIALERMVTQMPHKMQVSEARAAIRGVYVEIDERTGKAVRIERIDVVPEL